MQPGLINAAPLTQSLGTQDNSQTQPARVPDAVPQHLPKFFLFTQKGSPNETLVSGAELANMFGIDSFDVRKKWANHSTVIANAVNAAGNAIMVKRLIPADANPPARLLLALDVLEASIPVYTRNADGSFALDIAGNKVPTGTNITGYSVQWVLLHAPVAAFGQTAQGTAISFGLPTRSDATLVTTNNIYPIFEFEVASRGEYGNNVGIRLSAPTWKTTTSMPTAMMQSVRAYPYTFSMIERPVANVSPKIIATQMGDNAVMATLMPGSINPTTDSRLYAGDILLNSYRNITDPAYPMVYGNFGNFAIYQSNIDTLLNMFMATETLHLRGTSDFTAANTAGDYADKYLFNFVGGTDSSSIGYETFTMINTASSITLGQYTNIMASGGSDGTMTNATHAALVEAEMTRYLDPLDPLQELAINVESIIYDTGFPLQTKLALVNFIAQRRDTFVVLGTHEVDGPTMTSAEEASIALALRTRLQMFPESDYFGTPAMRGMIVGRSGLLRNSQYTKRLPLTAEIAIKSAAYMGAGDGRWKDGFAFDGAPGSVVDYMYDINIVWVPATVRNKNWDAGLNWVQAYNLKSFFFPALKTVYAGDTSVLNSYFTALAIGQLNKVANAAWREFSGNSTLTNAQLVKRVNEFVSNRVAGRFNNKFVIVPAAVVTNQDILNGFSWTLPITIYAANMKTVMTTYVDARRIADYVAK